MPRYRPQVEGSASGQTALPMDTMVTVIPRQSSKAGARNNVHSQELADQELVALATSFGFAPYQVRLDKRDMGISANTTTINDRPALREWLREALPSGASRVVVFSQEDRAFRDEEEVELNTFIKEVKRHHGWVICGHKVYRLWDEFDADMFRMMCKYAAKYIVHHVRGRLHPAAARAAQRGYHDGRGINVGYLVDYDPRSPTYKRYILYPPHADLVLHEMFERFARMPYPSVPALVRYWNASNGMESVVDPLIGEKRTVPRLYFPVLPPEIDRRNVARLAISGRRKLFPDGIDDPLRRGWQLYIQAARRILANVFYLGWVIRDGVIVRGEVLDNGQVRLDPQCPPLVLHEPLVKDSDLFWYCFEHVSSYTIEGQRNPKRQFFDKGPRSQHNDEARPFVHDPWPTTIRNAERNTLLLLGKLRCGIHRHTFMRKRLRPDDADRYACMFYDETLGHRNNCCMLIRGDEVDRVVAREFLDRLQLSDEDVQGIARAWQRQQQRAASAAARPRALARLQEVEQEIGNLVSALTLASSESVRQRLVAEMEKLTIELEHLRQQEQDFQQREAASVLAPLTSAALQAAKRTAKLLETLRAGWESASLVSRQALMQWAIEAVTIAPIPGDRKLLRGQITWRGGMQSPLELTRAYDRRQEWDEREREVLRRWYATARWEDLEKLLPGRKRNAVQMAACRMGIGNRPRHSIFWQGIPTEEMLRLAPTEVPMNAALVTMNNGQSVVDRLDDGVLLTVATFSDQ